jgi:hypothetical protein
VEDKDLAAAVGQVIKRCDTLFQQQPMRKVVYALVLSLDIVQVCRVQKLEGGSFMLECSRTSPLSISTEGAQSMYNSQLSEPCQPNHLAPGVLLIARLLATPMERLGFQSPRSPVAQSVGGSELGDFTILRSGGLDCKNVE